MAKISFTKEGIALADVPNAGVSKIDSNTKSGNARHDARSGKFGAGGGKPRDVKPTAPTGTDPVEYARFFDAVRDAAREFDDPDEGDIREFVQGRANSPSQVDITQFLQQVQAQRLNDVVDLIDQAMRSSGPLKRGRRKIRLTAPRGYLRKVLKGLQGDQLDLVKHRLEQMGHSTDDVNSYFGSRGTKAQQASADDAS